MFSWSKKNDSKKKTRRRGGSGGPVLNEFGLPMGQASGGNDEELEAELRALTGGVISPEDDLELNDDGSDVEAEFRRLFSDSKGKKKKSKTAGTDPVSKTDDVPLDLGGDFNMDQEGMDDEDIDVDENDPELLRELMGLTEGDEEEEEEGDDDDDGEPSSEEKEPEKKEVTVTSMLTERLNMYKMAEAKAKENNESSRARRFGRGIKTLQQLIKKAEAGQPVLPSEIPPVIATNLKPAPPPPVTTLQEQDVEDNSSGIENPENDAEGDDREPSSEEKEPEKKEVTVTSMLTERLNMYKMAEAKAKENNESSRARRFGRGIKTLQELMKKAEAGQPVLPSEIPPVIATNLKPAPPPPVTNSPDVEDKPSSDIADPENADPPTKEIESLSIDTKPKEGEICHDPPEVEPVGDLMEENPWLSILMLRRDEYKESALIAKRNNDLETALKHVKCVKQLNALITAAEQGEYIEESEIPPSLREPPRKTIEKVTPLKFEAPDDVEEYEVPKTVLEALNQRLRIYEGFKRESEKIGDEIGVRRNSKIVEIYSEALKLHKAGKRVPLAKLPTPPGCPPIPIPFELD